MAAILRLTDGTTYINLISSGSGFHLDEWKPAVSDYKNSGTYQDSPLSDGKRLVAAVYDNAVETFQVKLSGLSQDAAIRTTQDLRRLLKKAVDYWCERQNEPVWIEAKARDETNTRYAIVVKGVMANDDNPMGMPFLQPLCSKAVMDGLTIAVERGHWCALPPGTSEILSATISPSISNPINTTQLAAGAFAGNTINAVVAANGKIYSSAAGGRLYRSDNNGTTWGLASTTAGITIPRWGLSVSPNGTVFMMGHNGNTVIYKSTDVGATMTVVSTSATYVGNGGIIALTDTVIIAWWGSGPAASVIRRSIDGGVTWATIYTAVGTEDLMGILKLTDGTLLISARDATTGTNLYRGTNLGSSWTYTHIANGTNILYDMLETSRGVILGAWSWGSGGHGAVRISTDAGYTWNTMTSPSWFLAYPDGLAEDQYGHLYTNQNGVVYTSVEGLVWTAITGGTGGSWVVNTNNDLVLIGATTDVHRVNFSNTATQVIDSALVANKSNLANIDSVVLDDGGALTTLSPMITFPIELLPVVPAVNDAIYFGCNTGGNNSGPFCSLVFDLSVAASATTSYAITWEYYHTDTTWHTLTVNDNTAAGSAFGVTGVHTVHWVQPADWTTVAINTITGYWVRARVSALTGTMTAPMQQNRAVYSITSPNIEIDNVVGDLPALARAVVTMLSDCDGVGGSAPDLYTNRLICGARSYERGPTFNAYLNASDEQNPLGVTVAAGDGTTTFVVPGTDATVVSYTTGKRCLHNPTAAETTMKDIVTWTLSTLVARDYYGTFHTFMRGQQSGTKGDISVRLVITTGSGGVSWTSETKQFVQTTDFQLIDFGRITLPVSSLFNSDELADSTSLTIQATAVSGTPNLYIHDLILIPTDEWAGDFTDTVNTANSTLINGKVLVIDSVSNPRKAIAAKLKSGSPSGLTSSLWNAVANGPLTLEPNTTQRLWFLTARTAAVGASPDWRSEPYVCHSVQLYKNERYLSARGDR